MELIILITLFVITVFTYWRLKLHAKRYCELEKCLEKIAKVQTKINEKIARSS